MTKIQKITNFVDEVTNAIESISIIDASHLISNLEKAENLFQVQDVIHELAKVVGKPLDDQFLLLGVLDNELALDVKKFILEKLGKAQI